jgi:hypothetical protein
MRDTQLHPAHEQLEVDQDWEARFMEMSHETEVIIN